MSKRYMVYRGHEIERKGDDWVVIRNGETVYTTDTDEKAMAWIDVEREKAFAKSQRTAAASRK